MSVGIEALYWLKAPETLQALPAPTMPGATTLMVNYAVHR